MTCQVRFTGAFLVHDGELQRSLFGEPENDSAFVNQGDMRPPLLKDTKLCMTILWFTGSHEGLRGGI